jgi:hypothetical protein
MRFLAYRRLFVPSDITFKMPKVIGFFCLFCGLVYCVLVFVWNNPGLLNSAPPRPSHKATIKLEFDSR